MLQAIIEIELARLEALPDLSVQPELVTVGMQTQGITLGI